jgi:hypothetical protein
MHEPRDEGVFGTASTVSVRGTFSNWEPIYNLLDNDGDGIYSVTFPVFGTAGETISYKYAISTDAGQDVWESLADRTYVLGPDDVTVNVSSLPHLFNNLQGTRPRNLQLGDRKLMLAQWVGAAARPAPDAQDGAYLWLWDNVVGYRGYADTFVAPPPSAVGSTQFLQLTLEATPTEGSVITFGISETGQRAAGRLDFGKQYSLRLKATNFFGTSYSESLQITTPPQPTGNPAWAGSISESSNAERKAFEITQAQGLVAYKVFSSGYGTINIPANPYTDLTFAGESIEYFIGSPNGWFRRQQVTASAWSNPTIPLVTGSSTLDGTAILQWYADPSALFYMVQMPQGALTTNPNRITLGQVGNPMLFTANNLIPSPPPILSFILSNVPGHSYLTSNEGGAQLNSLPFKVIAVNGGGLVGEPTAWSSINLGTPTGRPGGAAAITLLPASDTRTTSGTARTFSTASNRRMWAKPTSGSTQFTVGGASVPTRWILPEDLADVDWLINGVGMNTIDRTLTGKLNSYAAPIAKKRFADSNFSGSYSGHFIDGRRYKVICNCKIYNVKSAASDYYTEAYLIPGNDFTLKVLFYTMFRQTVLQVGGPTLHYTLEKKVGIYSSDLARRGSQYMSPLVGGGDGPCFVRTTVPASEEEVVSLRIQVPAGMQGSVTTLVVAAV